MYTYIYIYNIYLYIYIIILTVYIIYTYIYIYTVYIYTYYKNMLKPIQKLMNIVMRIAPELYAGAWGKIPDRMAASALALLAVFIWLVVFLPL